MSTNLIDDIQQQVADERQQTASLYREILLRADHPEEADAEGLRACMTVLNIAPEQLQRDLETVKRIDALEQQINTWTPAEQAGHTAAISAVAAHVAETQRIERERSTAEIDLRCAYQGLENRRAAVVQAREELATLEQKRPILFGRLPAEPKAPPMLRIGPMPDTAPTKPLGPKQMSLGTFGA